MKTYTFLTGELVAVEATTLEEAEQKLANGEYSFLETATELQPEPCPNHNGNYDCHSFCPLCEGEQQCLPTN